MEMRVSTIVMTSLLTTLVLSTSAAWAKEDIYRWVDDNGVVHFGDRPDAHTDAEMIKIPERRVDSEPIPSDAFEAQPSYAQQIREERAIKKREYDKKRKKMGDECGRHRQIVEKLEPFTRVMIQQPDGSAIRMDDNERIEKLHTSKAFIAENCEH